MQDDCTAQAGAIAYYTLFSLTPLLVITVLIAAAVLGQLGLVDGTEDVRQRVVQQIGSTIGKQPAEQIAEMISQAGNSGHSRFATFGSLAILAFGATAMFAQIQVAMNTAWGVEPVPHGYGIKMFISKRLLSFGLVITVAFLLLVSMILSVMLQTLGDFITSKLSTQLDSLVPLLIQTVLNYFVITLVFAMMLKILPDAKVRWRDVWVGALITSTLFGMGRFGISIYLSQTHIDSGYGAAGSLVLLLVWIYYSAMIFLVGVEFTQVWTRYHGQPIIPLRGAMAYVKELRRIDHHDAVDEPTDQSAQQPN